MSPTQSVTHCQIHFRWFADRTCPHAFSSVRHDILAATNEVESRAGRMARAQVASATAKADICHDELPLFRQVRGVVLGKGELMTNRRFSTRQTAIRPCCTSPEPQCHSPSQYYTSSRMADGSVLFLSLVQRDFARRDGFTIPQREVKTSQVVLTLQCPTLCNAHLNRTNSRKKSRLCLK
jgi:hypothetical protein